MKVILLDYVYKHGVAGEVIDVADGFARNFLIPRKLAVKASSMELKRATKLRQQATVKRAALENTLNELSYIIDGTELIFARRAASTGKLFGSVTTQEIVEQLRSKGVEIDRRKIQLKEPIKSLGEYQVPIKLHQEVMAEIKVIVVAAVEPEKEKEPATEEAPETKTAPESEAE